MPNLPSLDQALDDLIRATRSGTAAWQRGIVQAGGLPRGVDGSRFRGIDALLLWERVPRAGLVSWLKADTAPDAETPSVWLPGPGRAELWKGEVDLSIDPPLARLGSFSPIETAVRAR